MAGFEAVTKVAFPPPNGLVQMVELQFIGSRMFRKPVANSEVSVEAREFAEIKIWPNAISD